MRRSGFRSPLHYFCLFTAGCTWVLICAGALVTSTESGLSVPDWPLSYGQFFPPMVGGIRFEHSHRLIAAFVAFLITAQAIWLWLSEARSWVRSLGLATLGLVLIQAALGGLTVLMLLPPMVSIAHACLAQTVFVFTGWIALATSKFWMDRPIQITREHSRGWALITLASLVFLFTFGQLILGALRRHGLLGLTPHLIGAGIVFTTVYIFFGFLLRRYKESTSLRLMGSAASVIVLAEILLGIAALTARLLDPHDIGPAWVTVIVTTAHVALGALLLLSSALLFLVSLRIHREDQIALFNRKLLQATAPGRKRYDHVFT